MKKFLAFSIITLGGIISTNSLMANSGDLTRGDAAKILVEQSGISIEKADQQLFVDQPITDSLTPYINTAHEWGWIGGYPDGTFNKDNKINRAEAAKMVVNVLGLDQMMPGIYFSDVSINDWHFGYVSTLLGRNIISADSGKFNPHEIISEAEFLTWIGRVKGTEKLLTNSTSVPIEKEKPAVQEEPKILPTIDLGQIIQPKNIEESTPIRKENRKEAEKDTSQKDLKGIDKIEKRLKKLIRKHKKKGSVGFKKIKRVTKGRNRGVRRFRESRLYKKQINPVFVGNKERNDHKAPVVEKMKSSAPKRWKDQSETEIKKLQNKYLHSFSKAAKKRSKK